MLMYFNSQFQTLLATNKISLRRNNKHDQISILFLKIFNLVIIIILLKFQGALAFSKMKHYNNSNWAEKQSLSPFLLY